MNDFIQFLGRGIALNSFSFFPDTRANFFCLSCLAVVVCIHVYIIISTPLDHVRFSRPSSMPAQASQSGGELSNMRI